MTEARWLACRTSRTMLDFVAGRLSERKLRLVGRACARRFAVVLRLDECVAALDLADRRAGGVGTAAEAADAARLAADIRNFATAKASSVPRRYRDFWTRQITAAIHDLIAEPGGASPDRLDTVRAVVADALECFSNSQSSGSKERLRQARITREVVGNPFRPVAFDPAWRTSDVRSIAELNYDSGDFTSFPILADALQDAGCEAADLLTHLRDPNAEHVRGCWALDLVLGKS